MINEMIHHTENQDTPPPFRESFPYTNLNIIPTNRIMIVTTFKLVFSNIMKIYKINIMWSCKELYDFIKIYSINDFNINPENIILIPVVNNNENITENNTPIMFNSNIILLNIFNNNITNIAFYVNTIQQVFLYREQYVRNNQTQFIRLQQYYNEQITTLRQEIRQNEYRELQIRQQIQEQEGHQIRHQIRQQILLQELRQQEEEEIQQQIQQIQQEEQLQQLQQLQQEEQIQQFNIIQRIYNSFNLLISYIIREKEEESREDCEEEKEEIKQSEEEKEEREKMCCVCYEYKKLNLYEKHYICNHMDICNICHQNWIYNCPICRGESINLE